MFAFTYLISVAVNGTETTSIIFISVLLIPGTKPGTYNVAEVN
jgi:hypothetical protein